jgi:hypothetical protein
MAVRDVEISVAKSGNDVLIRIFAEPGPGPGGRYAAGVSPRLDQLAGINQGARHADKEAGLAHDLPRLDSCAVLAI